MNAKKILNSIGIIILISIFNMSHSKAQTYFEFSNKVDNKLAQCLSKISGSGDYYDCMDSAINSYINYGKNRLIKKDYQSSDDEIKYLIIYNKLIDSCNEISKAGTNDSFQSVSVCQYFLAKIYASRNQASFLQILQSKRTK